MTETLIDIYNNIIAYDGIEINIIVDDKIMPWFNAATVTKILEYVRTNDAIKAHVDDIDKKTFDELKQFAREIPKNMQPHAIYINEYGLNSLILSSRMSKAKLFRKWIVEQVIPSIRKTGAYSVEEKLKKDLEASNNKLKSYRKENKILKNNQKKCKYTKGGKVYILRPVDARNPKQKKLGKTYAMDDRLNVYNTSVPDNMEVLFTLDVDDPESVELCVKSKMKKYIYRKRKEYYMCTTKILRQTMIDCEKIVKGEFYCDKCQKRTANIGELISHEVWEHDIASNDDLYIDIVKNCNDEEPNDEFINDNSDNNSVNSKYQEYCKNKYYKYKSKYQALKNRLFNK